MTLFIVLIVILAAGAGAYYWFFMKKGGGETEGDQDVVPPMEMPKQEPSQSTGEGFGSESTPEAPSVSEPSGGSEEAQGGGETGTEEKKW